MPTKVVNAQEPVPNPEPNDYSVTIVKVCEEGAEAFGPFSVTFDATIDWDIELFNGDTAEPWGTETNETVDETYDVGPLPIECGGEVVLEGDPTNNTGNGNSFCSASSDLAYTPGEELDELVDFLCTEGPAGEDDITSGTAIISEEEVLGVIAEYEGCEIDLIDDSEGGFWDTYRDFGLLCTITNSVDVEAIPNLIITKECLSGDGDGDGDFNVVVSTELGAAVDSDSLDCGEVMVVADLDEGTYRIQEFITGPDAALFLTAIVCTTADGQTVTPGSGPTDVELELGFDVECAIVNVFLGAGDDVVDPDDPDAPAAPVVIVPIDLDNTNTNTLDNDNLNTNNNENTNTQEQSNHQEQINDNNQTTTVNSSPSVVIDFDD
jgi:hypothetical protein